MVITEGKRAAKTRQNREAIFNAAIFIVKQYGVEALTVKNICEIAKISNGSFYHLYASKEDLINHYLSYAYEHYHDSAKLDAVGLSAREQILYLYDMYIEVCVEVGPGFMSIVYSTSNKSLDFISDKGNRTDNMEAIEKCWRRGVEQGEFKPDLSFEEVFFEMSSIVTGVMFYWCLCNGEHVDPQAEARNLLGIYLDTVVL